MTVIDDSDSSSHHSRVLAKCQPLHKAFLTDGSSQHPHEVGTPVTSLLWIRNWGSERLSNLTPLSGVWSWDLVAVRSSSKASALANTPYKSLCHSGLFFPTQQQEHLGALLPLPRSLSSQVPQSWSARGPGGAAPRASFQLILKRLTFRRL